MMEVEDGLELCFPELLNTSCRRPVSSEFQTLFLRILLYSFSVFTVAPNLLVIISVSHFRKLHTPTNLLLRSLAVSDFLVGLLLMPGAILPKTSCWFLGDVMCLICNYVAAMINSSAVGNIVLISVDRYVAICDPLHYTTRITVRRVKLCVFLCWFISALYGIFFSKNILTQPGRYNSCHGECVVHIDYISGAVDFSLNLVVPVTVIIILYMRVFVVAVFQARAMRSHVTAVTLQVSVTLTSKKSELKAARTLGILIVVFLICLCPYYIAVFAGYNSLTTSSAFSVLYLYYFNSCLNPVIYALFYPWFRKAVKLIVTLQILQPGSCDVNML